MKMSLEVDSLPSNRRKTAPCISTLNRIRLRKYLPFYVIVAPVILYYVLFSYVPMAGVIIAFKNYTFRGGIWRSEWVGLANFNRFLRNGEFWRVLRNTLILSFYHLVFSFPAPIIFALLLNEIPLARFRKTIQIVTYLPHFISWVVINGLLFSLLSQDGVINNVLATLGFEKFRILGNPGYYRGLLVGSAIWKETGWRAIIYLAALSGIDPALYESASIDGARRLQRIWYITLPSIRTVISILFVLSFANVLDAGFQQVVATISPSVFSVGETLDYYVYRVGLTLANNFSYATAVGLFKSLVALGLILATNWGAKRIDEDGGLW